MDKPQHLKLAEYATPHRFKMVAHSRCRPEQAGLGRVGWEHAFCPPHEASADSATNAMAESEEDLPIITCGNYRSGLRVRDSRTIIWRQ